MENNDEIFLTIRQVAGRLNVSRDLIDRWIRNGELPAINVAESATGKNKRWRIHVSDLVEFERTRKNQPEEKQPRRRRRARTPPSEHVAGILAAAKLR